MIGAPGSRDVIRLLASAASYAPSAATCTRWNTHASGIDDGISARRERAGRWFWGPQWLGTDRDRGPGARLVAAAGVVSSGPLGYASI